MKSIARQHHAVQINREHALAQSSAKSAIKHAIRCGKLLLDRKTTLSHGEFMPWIKKHCKFSQATANNYMKAAQVKTPNALGFSIRHLFPSGREPSHSNGVVVRRLPSAAVERDLEEDPSPDSGKERREESPSDEEHWVAYCGLLLGELLAARAHWRREFGPSWEKFTAPTHLVTLTEQAIEELHALHGQLSKQRE